MTTHARPARRADAAENDAVILAAAARLVRAGSTTPSIREVAAEASVGSTTVYRRFATQEVLHSRTIATIVCDLLAPAVQDALAHPDPMVGLRRITDTLVDVTAQQPRELVRLGDLVSTFLARFRAPLTSLMEAAQRDGRLRPDILPGDIDGITTVMFAGLALPPHAQQTAHRYVALLFDGLSRTDGSPLPT